MYRIAKFDTHYVTGDMKRKNIKTPSWFKCPTHTPEVVVLVHGHKDGLSHLGVWERLQCWAVRNWKTDGCFSTVDGDMGVSEIALHTGLHGYEDIIEVAIDRLIGLGWIIMDVGVPVGGPRAGHGHDTGTPREEKRREKKKKEQAASKSPARKSRIQWIEDEGWTGITAEDGSAWAVAFPLVDIAGELAKMHVWLRANPRKANKRQWNRFITGWLGRSQGSPSSQDRPVASSAWGEEARAS